MPKVYIIMGKDNTRKSAIIRCLTGFRQEKKKWQWYIATQKRIIIIYIQITSLQETYDGKGISAEDFIYKISILKPSNILVALRFKNNRKNKTRDSFAYIKEFIKAKWKISEIVALGMNEKSYNKQKPNNLRIPKPLFISNLGSDKKPTNEIAAAIRKKWGWL